jgi:CRISPR-associated protein Csd1
MILQCLTRLHDRLLAEGRLEAPGFQRKEILWLIGLNPDGTVASLRPTGRGKERPQRFAVPTEIKKSVNIAANLLWENAEYALGVPKAKANEQQAAKVPARHAAFKERIGQLSPDALADEGVRAVLAFLEKGDLSALQAHDDWAELAEGGANVSFHLAGEERLVCERPAVRTAIAAETDPIHGTDDLPWCLVSGARALPARLHPSIKGVFGGQSSGTSLVSFNEDAFKSHGWEQGGNAPVGEPAAHAYAAALNHMLERRPGDEMVYSHREGETTFLFWAESENSAIQKYFPLAMGERAESDPDTDGKPMKHTLNGVRRGLVEGEKEDRATAYYVLALAPNAARLAVRFWVATTVGDMADKLEAHFQALEIIGPDEDRPIPTLWRLLGELMPKADIKLLKDGLRGRLSADILHAILKGTPYPATLLARAVERCRLENSVRPLRAALIKAVLSRRPTTKERPPTMSLDLQSTNPGYLLGRLFAVLESIQHAAQGKINTTIRDRYFGAAMASPRAVFTQLERLKSAHLKKLRRDKGGLGFFFEKECLSITDGLTAIAGFPAFLSLDDQGRFILGYQHQRFHYLTKSDAATPDLAHILAATSTESDE